MEVPQGQLAGHVLGRGPCPDDLAGFPGPSLPSSAAHSLWYLFQTGLRRGTQTAQLLDWPVGMQCELVGHLPQPRCGPLVTVPSPLLSVRGKQRPLVPGA